MYNKKKAPRRPGEQSGCSQWQRRLAAFSLQAGHVSSLLLLLLGEVCAHQNQHSQKKNQERELKSEPETAQPARA